eukprot:3326222-Rhodomonas_salina.2
MPRGLGSQSRLGLGAGGLTAEWGWAGVGAAEPSVPAAERADRPGVGSELEGDLGGEDGEHRARVPQARGRAARPGLSPRSPARLAQRTLAVFAWC